MSEARKYYGKFRGTVLDPVDPNLMGRVKLLVTVGGAPLTLTAEACTPYPGFYAIPPIGSGVWVEFEEGDIDKPIWTGCWWRDGEILAILQPGDPPPDASSAPATVVFAVSPARTTGTPSVARLKLSSTDGTATLECLMPPASPATPTAIALSTDGVDISYMVQKIHLGQATIDLNDGAISVLPSP